MTYYRNLYSLQDKILRNVNSLETPFYLTGGTALGRFYLDHRWSDDLDFFLNKDENFHFYVKAVLSKLSEDFNLSNTDSLFTEDFVRTFVIENEQPLKIEFVKDIDYYVGETHLIENIKIDNPKNILCNKLTAIIGRDEPKDVFDVICLAKKYSFNWREIFIQAKEKSFMNEIDIIERIEKFPVELFQTVIWRKDSLPLTDYKSILKSILHDFTLGSDNSIGKNEIKIENAVPVF
jgi:predicted nucleotidyltransferase component of viral defense system